MRIGIPELLVILFIVILIFGASRLPELGKGLGKRPSARGKDHVAAQSQVGRSSVSLGRATSQGTKSIADPLSPVQKS